MYGRTIGSSMEVRLVMRNELDRPNDAHLGEERGARVLDNPTAANSIAAPSTREQMARQAAQAIAVALEMRDPYTADHHRRTAKLAHAIACQMHLGPDAVAGITLAASLHDVGKLKVPGDILAKPGRLTLPEVALMQEHCAAGYDILKPIDFPWPVAEMVFQHHERLDGSGYPRGLNEHVISTGARIIAVADIVQAMTTHRPYRAALSLETAIDELERGKRRLYDASVVDACVSLMKRSHADPVRADGTEDTPDPLLRLTLQQTAVMQLLAQGRSVKEIARNLHLGIGTVKTHLSHVYAVLGVHNRVEAVVRAGLIRF